MKKALWTWLAVGTSVAGLAFMGGCVVTSDDDPATGGSAGASGGSGGSGGSTGGAGGATGGTDAGTGGATGGAAGADAGTVSCKADDPTNTCQTCTEQKCCVEFEACYAGGDACGSGGPKGEGEINCMFEHLNANPGDVSGAAAACTTPGAGTISTKTNDIYSCLDTNCLTECIP